MKKLLTVILALTLILSCFAGCSKKDNNDDISSNNDSGNTSQLNENEFADSSNLESEVSLNEGEFDPLSIVKEEYISYDGGRSDFPGHCYNGGGRIQIVFSEDFEVEIIPGLFLKRMVRNSVIHSNSLDIIANNQLLGSIEFYFIGETLKYNNINKLSEGDVVKLMFREHKDSNGLEDNLIANGFSYLNIPEYITVPNLGELFKADDVVEKEDIDYAVAAQQKISSTFGSFSLSEKPVAVYVGIANSPTVIGDSVVLNIIFKRTYTTGKEELYMCSSAELTKHDKSNATCILDSSKSRTYKIGIADSDMIATWDTNYTWEKFDY